MATNQPVLGLADLPPEERRRLEAALLQRQMGQQAVMQASQMGQSQYTPQGRIVRKSPLEYLAKAAQMGLGAYGAYKGGQEAQAIQSEAEAARTGERTAIMDALMGKAPEPQAGPLRPQDAPLQDLPGRPADPQAAMRLALKSRFPSLQAQGAAMQERQADRVDKVGMELAKNATTPSAAQFANTGDLTQLAPRPNAMTVGDAIVNRNPDTGGITPVSGDRFTPGTTTVAGMQVPTNTDTWTGKVTPNAAVGSSANPGVQVGMDASKSRREFLEKGKEAADSATATAKTIVNAAKVMQQGYTSGQFADQRVAAAKFFTMLGGKVEPKDVNAETVGMLLTQLAEARVRYRHEDPDGLHRHDQH
jgi:hypothetical protein